jgi:hypothetical protein
LDSILKEDLRLYNVEKFNNLKENLNNSFGKVVDEIVSKYAEEVKEYTKNNIKEYVWELLPALIADQDLTKFGFDSKKDFYTYIDTWKVRNKIRKDFRDELMTELMQDFQRENRGLEKAIDVIAKNIKSGNRYNLGMEAIDNIGEELRLLGKLEEKHTSE